MKQQVWFRLSPQWGLRRKGLDKQRWHIAGVQGADSGVRAPGFCILASRFSHLVTLRNFLVEPASVSLSINVDGITNSMGMNLSKVQ